MKILLVMTAFIVSNISVRADLPGFLEGTWKIGDEEKFEQWDMLYGGHMKGIAYEIRNHEVVITEYLEIGNADGGIVYTATVLGQNQRRGIPFQLTESGSAWVFENPGHDFPTRISYRKKSDREVFVEVSGGSRGFSYLMTKVSDNESDTAHRDTRPDRLGQDQPEILESVNPDFDESLARQLGADVYGMKSYVLVILKTGSHTTASQEESALAFRGHMENISRLSDEGKLIVAGPLGRNEQTYRGIFVFDVASVEDARDLVQTDPAVAAGLLEADLYPWYGSAALPLYLESARKIWREQP